MQARRKTQAKRKRTVYVVATLATMAIFLPFQNHAWSVYTGACAGYSVLVFGLRRIKTGSNPRPDEIAKSATSILQTHMAVLLVVIGWVWFALLIKPHLPYILRTDDSSHPYFGLAFLGTLGLLGLEAIEQRWLDPETPNRALDPKDGSPLYIGKCSLDAFCLFLNWRQIGANCNAFLPEMGLRHTGV